MAATARKPKTETASKMSRPKFDANVVPIRAGMMPPKAAEASQDGPGPQVGQKQRRSKEEMAALRLERAAKRDERERRKALAITVGQQIAQAIKSVPADFQQWGYVRTNAWLQLVSIARRRVSRTSPAQLERLQVLHATMANISTMSIEECAALASGGEKKLFDSGL